MAVITQVLQLYFMVYIAACSMFFILFSETEIEAACTYCNQEVSAESLNPVCSIGHINLLLIYHIHMLMFHMKSQQFQQKQLITYAEIFHSIVVNICHISQIIELPSISQSQRGLCYPIRVTDKLPKDIRKVRGLF